MISRVCRLGVVLLAAGALAACGGGSKKGQPSSLSLQGVSIPTSQVVSGVQGLCTLGTALTANPAGATTTYYGAPYKALHQLATVLNGNHGAAASELLSSMQTFETDLNATPAPPGIQTDLQALITSTNNGLKTLSITSTVCGPAPTTTVAPAPSPTTVAPTPASPPSSAPSSTTVAP